MIFDFLVSFSIVIIETPQNSAPRYSGIVSLSKEAARWRYVGGVEMFEYSWMLVFVAINGLLTVGEMDTKEECASAAAQMEQVGTEGITGNFACIPAPNYIAEGSVYE